jgi:hypothetical protein
MSLERGRPSRRRYRRDAASAYLKETYGLDCAPATLAKLAVTGGGPIMEYVGRWPHYPEDCLDEWALSKTSSRVRSTSELRTLKTEAAAR